MAESYDKALALLQQDVEVSNRLREEQEQLMWGASLDQLSDERKQDLVRRLWQWKTHTGTQVRRGAFASEHLTGLEVFWLAICMYSGPDGDTTNTEKRLRTLHRINLPRSPSLHLNGADLDRQNLAGAYLHNVHLRRANLHGSNMSRAHLMGAQLAEANLSEASLIDIDLSRAHLCKAQLTDVDLSGACMIDTDLREAKLGRAELANANLLRARLAGADLSDASLTDANLRDTDLTGANLCDAYLRRTTLVGAQLDGTHLRDAILSHAKLADAHLRGTDLRGADLTQAEMAHVDLTHADLRGADLKWANLREANLTGANLHKTDLRWACLAGADLTRADLTGADLTGADLTGSSCIATDFKGATLTGCRVYGISSWDVKLENAIQNDLRITPEDQPALTIDNLKVAQFIYLLLNNAEVRAVLDTITSRVVLILGRFSAERKPVLDAVREALRSHPNGYIPVLFDFDPQQEKPVFETVKTLANLARFVIADLTDPNMVRSELSYITANVPTVPVQPVILCGAHLPTEYETWRRYDTFLPVFHYADLEQLLASLSEAVIDPVEQHVQARRLADADSF